MKKQHASVVKPCEQPANEARCSLATGSAIACIATNPGQWITLYDNGKVRIHTRNLSGKGTRPYRTFVYRPKRKLERDALRALISHLNLTASGYEGEECQVCDCFHSPNA